MTKKGIFLVVEEETDQKIENCAIMLGLTRAGFIDFLVRTGPRRTPEYKELLKKSRIRMNEAKEMLKE